MLTGDINYIHAESEREAQERSGYNMQTCQIVWLKQMVPLLLEMGKRSKTKKLRERGLLRKHNNPLLLIELISMEAKLELLVRVPWRLPWKTGDTRISHHPKKDTFHTEFTPRDNKHDAASAFPTISWFQGSPHDRSKARHCLCRI
ncbi:hypothetical protein HYC85_007201 [Camellia sinensis]|uniref:Uncharacterized protein n=1 Tax=Camellia sinensis TaxID=4442 RepID=A0A7J7HP67_CAMSI|nr:hypothetical protein HYC85_007201 [Camellia sinensis]